MSNPVQDENALPGSHSWELTDPAVLREIEGYCNLTSVNAGSPINFHISARQKGGNTYTFQIYRVGWYNGAGARLVFDWSTPILAERHVTPANYTWGPVTAGSFQIFNGCQWPSSYTLNVPSSWVSGVYLVKLRTDAGKEAYMIFTVRNDDQVADVLIQTSSSSWQSYNHWPFPNMFSNSEIDIPGSVHWGRSHYAWAPGGRAWRVAYNRPYGLTAAYAKGGTAGIDALGPPRIGVPPQLPAIPQEQIPDYYPGEPNPRPHGWLWGQGHLAKGLGAGEFITNHAISWPQWYDHYPMGWELNAVRFFERNSDKWSIKYFDNTDLHHSGSYLQKTKVMVSMGHDEYWSREMVEHVQHARSVDKVSFCFLGANDAYWECRWEPDPFNSVADRVLTCFKESTAQNLDTFYTNRGITNLSQCTFRLVAAAENRWDLFEGNFQGMGYIGDPANQPIRMVMYEGDHWALDGTGFSATNNMIPSACGYETDMYAPGQFWLPALRSGTSFTVLAHTVLRPFPYDVDSTFPGACANWTGGCPHHLLLFQVPSGAYTFSTGSMHFCWALDDFGSQWGPDMRPKAEHAGTKRMLANILDRMVNNPDV